MLHEHKAQAGVDWQMAQELRESLQAAGGGADPHNPPRLASGLTPSSYTFSHAFRWPPRGFLNRRLAAVNAHVSSRSCLFSNFHPQLSGIACPSKSGSRSHKRTSAVSFGRPARASSAVWVGHNVEKVLK